MSFFTFYDVEMYSDREEDLQKLFAELAAEDGAEDELPPILQDEGLGEAWEWTARAPFSPNLHRRRTV